MTAQGLETAGWCNGASAFAVLRQSSCGADASAEGGGGACRAATSPSCATPGAAACARPAAGTTKVPDFQAPAYSTDDFRINCYKVTACTIRATHDWKTCPFVHPGEHGRRRPLSIARYEAVMCPQVRRGEPCPLGDTCPKAHNVFEMWLHPDRYRTQICIQGTACTRKVCFFAHTPEELRRPASRKAASSGTGRGASRTGGSVPAPTAGTGVSPRLTASPRDARQAVLPVAAAGASPGFKITPHVSGSPPGGSASSCSPPACQLLASSVGHARVPSPPTPAKADAQRGDLLAPNDQVAAAGSPAAAATAVQEVQRAQLQSAAAAAARAYSAVLWGAGLGTPGPHAVAAYEGAPGLSGAGTGGAADAYTGAAAAAALVAAAAETASSASAFDGSCVVSAGGPAGPGAPLYRCLGADNTASALGVLGLGPVGGPAPYPLPYSAMLAPPVLLAASDLDAAHGSAAAWPPADALRLALAATATHATLGVPTLGGLSASPWAGASFGSCASFFQGALN